MTLGEPSFRDKPKYGVSKSPAAGPPSSRVGAAFAPQVVRPPGAAETTTGPRKGPMWKIEERALS
jgi:hypothetical protein